MRKISIYWKMKKCNSYQNTMIKKKTTMIYDPGLYPGLERGNDIEDIIETNHIIGEWSVD